MAKGFAKNNPLDRLSGAGMPADRDMPGKNVMLPATEQQEPVKENLPAGRRRVGRPKTKDVKNTCRNINVAVPVTLLDKWEDVKIVHGSNLTAYITRLIGKDMDANYEHYKKIADSTKNL